MSESVWNRILWNLSTFCFKQMLKFSAFYLEKQKSFIPKKKFRPLSISKQKSFVYWLNFPEGFADSLLPRSLFTLCSEQTYLAIYTFFLQRLNQKYPPLNSFMDVLIRQEEILLNRKRFLKVLCLMVFRGFKAEFPLEGIFCCIL